MRRKLLEVSPKMGVAEISKKIGEKWKQLPSEQREKYIHEAALIKQEHLKNHPDFIYTRRSKAELAEAKRLSKLRRTKNNDTLSPNMEKSLVTKEQQQRPTSTSTKRRRKSNAPDAPRDPRGRKKKRHRHPTAPKHPMSPFLFFLAAVRPHVAQQFPGSTVGPISKVIGAQWRDMSDEARIPWIQMAEQDKARYAREMRVYMANLDQQAQKQNVIDTTADTEDLDDHAVAAVVQMVNSGSDERNFYPPTTSSSSNSSNNHFETMFPQSNECI
ncbi:HMG-box [Lichtheimia hyalospora FSU 10163]|nr:HMG-box [Lichtheimia hyalospora FSU 10163]